MTPVLGVKPAVAPPAPVREVTSGSPSGRRPASPDLSSEMKKAASAFEAILVRQMLAAASVAGKGSYADMGVEALSTAVTAGGGLGLGHAIEQAISRAHRAQPVAPEPPKK